jgi:hypothetical protein
MDVEVGQRDERPDVFVGITKRLAGELHPRVGEKLSVGAADADPHEGALNAAFAQHSRESDGASEALWTEHAEPGGAGDGEGEPPRFRHPRYVHVLGADSRGGELANRLSPQCCLRNEQGPLRLQELSPLTD